MKHCYNRPEEANRIIETDKEKKRRRKKSKVQKESRRKNRSKK